MKTNTNAAPPWALGSFIWRLSLPDQANALEEASSAIAKVQNLLDHEGA
jgi:hypothetical protein